MIEYPEKQIGLFTQKETSGMTIDPTSTWHQYDVVIYSPTVTAGNSFTGPIEIVYGIFVTSTCGMDAALQMLFRCRTATKYYVCVKDTHMRKRKIPDNIGNSVKSIMKWLSYRDNILRMEDSVLPMNEIPIDYINGEVENKYLELYAGYLHEEEKRRKDYLFYLLLYMRDMGIRFKGLISRLTNEDNESYNVTKKDYKLYSDEIKQVKLQAIVDAPIITDDEYNSLKSVGRKDEMNKVIKYRIMKRYGIEVITPRIVEYTRRVNYIYDNLILFYKVLEIDNDGDRKQIMENIYQQNKPKDVSRIGQRLSLQERRIYNEGLKYASEYATLTESEYRDKMFCNIHGINILRILGCKNIQDVFSGSMIDIRLCQEYKRIYGDQMKSITKRYDESKLLNNILYQAFGIEINEGRLRCKYFMMIDDKILPKCFCPII